MLLLILFAGCLASCAAQSTTTTPPPTTSTTTPPPTTTTGSTTFTRLQSTSTTIQSTSVGSAPALAERNFRPLEHGNFTTLEHVIILRTSVQTDHEINGDTLARVLDEIRHLFANDFHLYLTVKKVTNSEGSPVEFRSAPQCISLSECLSLIGQETPNDAPREVNLL